MIPRNVFAIVNRDIDNPALASDWFGIANYTYVAMSGIDFIGLHMDDGMGRMVVKASLNEFIADLDAVSLSYQRSYLLLPSIYRTLKNNY